MRKVWIFITALVVLLVPVKTLASSNQDFKITDNDYEVLSLFYTPEYISGMTYEEYMDFKAKNINPENVLRTSKYYRVVINHLTNEVEETEITEEEYENAEVPEPDRSYVYETTYKRLALTIDHESDISNFFSLTNTWKMLPSTRSYDDIGVRYVGFDIISGSQIAKQFYTYNGTNYYINYPYGGINSQYFNNGFGVSMGLFGGDITKLQLSISGSLVVTSYPATLYASYQHAIDTITLSTAKSYTIGTGMGYVFVFNNGVGIHYDGMSGVYGTVYS